MFFLTKIHGDHRISNMRNDLSFVNECFIIVHNKTILKKIGMKTVFDEMCYIVEYFILNILFFVIAFDCKKKDKNNMYTSFLNGTEP